MQSMLASLGTTTLAILAQIGATVRLLVMAWRRVGALSWQETIRQMYLLGVKSVPIVSLTLLFTGMVMTVQIASELIRYGAEFSIGAIVTLAMGRELGPVLAGVVLAGRAGAAITAEIGTMKVTEQIDALRCMATDPVTYLVVPRMVACMLMLPLLDIFGLIIGTGGGMLVATLVNGVSAHTYLTSIDTFVVPTDVYMGMIKTICFGMMIAVIACDRGMQAKSGAEGVGVAVTQTVVYAMVMIFAVNYLLSSVLF